MCVCVCVLVGSSHRCTGILLHIHSPLCCCSGVLRQLISAAHFWLAIAIISRLESAWSQTCQHRQAWHGKHVHIYTHFGKSTAMHRGYCASVSLRLFVDCLTQTAQGAALLLCSDSKKCKKCGEYKKIWWKSITWVCFVVPPSGF